MTLGIIYGIKTLGFLVSYRPLDNRVVACGSDFYANYAR